MTAAGRTHGEPPYGSVVVHGGPGAAGALASVARTLSDRHGVLEPLQTATSVDAQVDELRRAIDVAGAPPVTLIGHSWGAWLAVLLAARHPELVRKLVLIGSGGFRPQDAGVPDRVRRERLSSEQRAEVDRLTPELARTNGETQKQIFARLGELFGAVDAYAPIPDGRDRVDLRPDVFLRVWHEAATLRESGRLLEATRAIRCPVVAFHGVYDPHPADGVRLPLEQMLSDFRFVLLERCGHEPWNELHARDAFFRRLRMELGEPADR